MDIYYSLMIFCFVGSVTPGPNNIMIMNSALNYGVYRSLPHYLGICIGFIFILLAVGFGLGEVFNHYLILHKVLKIIGSIYLFYLAIKIMRSNTNIDINSFKGKPISFLQAVLLQWTNPKGIILAINVFALFNFANIAIANQILLITSTYFIILLPSTAFWLLGGTVIKKIIKHPHQIKAFNIVMGLLLILSIGLVYLE